ncbi:MAG: peptidase S1, partial [Spirochaetaceae bacterium]
MRLYSRTQLIVAAVSSAVFTLLAVIAIGPLVDGGQAGRPTSQSQQAATESSAGSTGGFVLQTGDSALDSAAGGEDSGLSLDELETIRVFEARNDGVVNISTQRVTLNWFFEPVPEQGQSGSGSIIDQRGYVLTNNHVVRGASEITVTLADGTSLPGEVIGTDPENDLAVLKIDPHGRELTTIPLGRSDNLRVGQKVLAIGNPFAIGRTLTTGVVSGLDRSVRADANFVINGLIQTDASINPGNSGGPLLNSRGEMIGVNTMIYSSTGGSIGIGFAVPSETARRIVPDLIEFGAVRRGWIEMTPVQLFPQLVRFARLPVSSGLLVS